MSENIYYRGKKQNGIKRDVHRIVMEGHIGRQLERTEVVHHINGNIHDNRIENLQLMTLSEHSRMHMKGAKLPESTKKKLSQALTGKEYLSRWALTEEQAMDALRRNNSGESWRSIGRAYGLHHNVVIRVVNRYLNRAKEVSP